MINRWGACLQLWLLYPFMLPALALCVGQALCVWQVVIAPTVSCAAFSDVSLTVFAQFEVP